MKPTRTIDEEIAELQRELSMRKSVYESWIHAGRMTRDKANKQYKALESALIRLKNLKHSNQKRLFDEDKN